jgi:hypothetical protein
VSRHLAVVVCPMFNDPCPHCSIETVTRPYTRLKKNSVTRLFEPDGQGSKKIELGEFCNNDGRHYVRDMHWCPRRWALANPKGVDFNDELRRHGTCGKLHRKGDKKLHRDADVHSGTRAGSARPPKVSGKTKKVQPGKTRRVGTHPSDDARSERSHRRIQQGRKSSRNNKTTTS